MPSFHIVTYGCQMNEHDSEGLAGLLLAAGYTEANDETEADVVILNTCAVRDRPERKAQSALGALASRKRAGSLSVIGVCGCMGQEHGERLLERFPELDFVCGPGSLTAVTHLVEEALEGRRGCALDLLADAGARLPRAHGSSHRAYVDITYGCSNYCAYCIVPFVRGPMRSRPAADIIDEVRGLAARGWSEVILLGQNVNAYGQDLGSGCPDFAELLAEVDRVDGVRRVRFTTSHPRDFTREMLEAVAALPSVCEHLHLPVQAGDDAILAAMNRGYTREYYLDLVASARELIEGVSITTDVMVGFPGETDDQFERTYELFATVRFDQAFVFAYVPRPRTAALEMGDTVPREVKVERLRRLAELQKRVSRERNAETVGSLVEVLIDGPSAGDASMLAGRTRTNKLVVFPQRAGVAPGQFVTVRTIQPRLWGFIGELVETG